MAPPIAFAQIEPVGQCNLRCRMCPIQFRRDGPPHGPLAFMPLATFRRLIDQLPDLRSLHLQGMGEPLMHPQFFEMVRYAAARGVRVSTNTNLTLLSERRARLCVESGLHELHVSIDGATAATYEAIRVRSRFARVLRHLEWLQRAREACKASAPEVRIVAVVMRRNLEELPGLVELAHRYGVRRVFVQHLCHDFAEESLPAEYRPMRHFVDDESLLGVPVERIDAWFGRARERALALGVDLRLPRARPRAEGPAPGARRCEWPWRGPYISYRGEAMPCCMVSTPDRINFGNMADQGIETVWRSAPYEAFRAGLDGDTPPEVCRSCSVYQGVF
ncbi:radical SAM protein [Sulfurifustis variabilis]|uniref:Radical SAM protein n=1 Tax=Sulfurifustis variabilis TaxID=1675686 RepID=A0A1B4VDL9_9GAMM|nr:radical SAM protein [Sulfurifustis variabilis]BAU48287.1 radical SAM protein [Sulfurifustis variabilis]